VVGGGSNLVVADEGFDGRVVVVCYIGLCSEGDICGGVYVEIGVGEDWDGVVVQVVDNGWVGIEVFFGILGIMGVTLI